MMACNCQGTIFNCGQPTDFMSNKCPDTLTYQSDKIILGKAPY